VVDASEMQHIFLPQAGQVPAKSMKTIRFKDCVGRTFSVPFSLCRTWQVSLIIFCIDRLYVVC
jgi:hypothetical protein